VLDGKNPQKYLEHPSQSIGMIGYISSSNFEQQSCSALVGITKDLCVFKWITVTKIFFGVGEVEKIVKNENIFSYFT